jgi:hypothetical protein
LCFSQDFKRLSKLSQSTAETGVKIPG